MLDILYISSYLKGYLIQGNMISFQTSKTTAITSFGLHVKSLPIPPLIHHKK